MHPKPIPIGTQKIMPLGFSSKKPEPSQVRSRSPAKKHYQRQFMTQAKKTAKVNNTLKTTASVSKIILSGVTATQSGSILTFRTTLLATPPKNLQTAQNKSKLPKMF